MCVYIYIYMYVYVLCVCTYTHVCMCMGICIYTYMCVWYMCVYMCVKMYICNIRTLLKYVYLCVHIYIYMITYVSELNPQLLVFPSLPPSFFTALAPSTITSSSLSGKGRLGIARAAGSGSQRCVPCACCMAATNSSAGSLRRKKVFCHRTIPDEMSASFCSDH